MKQKIESALDLPQRMPLNVLKWCLQFIALLLSGVWAQVGFAGASPWVNVDLSSGHLRIATEIAGIAGESVIDTGANMNGINSRFLAKHNLAFKRNGKVRVAGVYDAADHAVFGKVPGKIFSTELIFRDLVEIEFGAPDTQLLLGADFLSLFIFQFDYPNSRMRVLTRDTLNLKKVANLKTERDTGGGLPIVKVNLNGEKNVWLTLDTGSTGGLLLERNLAKRFNWLERYPAKQSYGRGINAGAEMEVFNLPNMTFGPFELANNLVSVPATNKPIEMFKKTANTGSRLRRRSGKAQGLLGYDVLKHFVLTIDYKTGRAHVAEPAELTQ